MEAYEILKKARDARHPSGKAFIQNLCSDFFELRGDRRFGDDHAIIGGIGRIEGMPLTIIAHERGTELADKARRNFGMAHPEGYRKALRLMQGAEKFNRPVLCLVDTTGAYSGIGAEERGQGYAIAENLGTMMDLKVPILTIILGEGGSGGALALAVANQVWMMEYSIYSVISPEGCSSILWKDASRVRQACECLKATPEHLLAMGLVERVIPEQGGEEAVFESLRGQIVQALGEMQAQGAEALCAQRYARFRGFGIYSEG